MHIGVALQPTYSPVCWDSCSCGCSRNLITHLPTVPRCRMFGALPPAPLSLHGILLRTIYINIIIHSQPSSFVSLFILSALPYIHSSFHLAALQSWSSLAVTWTQMLFIYNFTFQLTVKWKINTVCLKHLWGYTTFWVSKLLGRKVVCSPGFSYPLYNIIFSILLH